MGYPTQEALPSVYRPTPLRDRLQWFHLLPLLLVLPYLQHTLKDTLFPEPPQAFIHDGLSRCAALDEPAAFRARLATETRTANDRFVPGTPSVLLKNGSLWTGRSYGNELITGGEILLKNGLIHVVGKQGSVRSTLSKEELRNVEEIDLNGAWVTPGIVDLHSHLGVDSTPELQGTEDTNSLKAPVLPWLRSIDGIHTHDAAYNLSIAGGLTTALVLPGSANNLGGQAFIIKPRQTRENTPSLMQVDPPFVIDENGGIKRTGHWRHAKHATGENIKGLYGDNRFDQAFNFRRAYGKAQKLKEKQDAWCAVGKDNTEPYPDDIEWEALVDVLRGNLKVNIHSYQTVDFDELVRLSNEFKFNIAAVHHAHEAYLVPDLLKKTYGGAPAAAIFATNFNYKAEAQHGSNFAPKLLADAKIDVVMKSDHPVLDSRFLLYEAQQAHHYGLHAAIALSAVTTTPARIMGVDYRLGSIAPGKDADLVVWDSHPLQLGATPLQTYIDGIPQLDRPFAAVKSKAHLQQPPKTPDWKGEAELHLQARGEPDHAALLKGRQAKNGDVAFVNVENVWLRGTDDVDGLVDLAAEEQGAKTVVIRGGKIACTGKACADHSLAGIEVVDLKNGSVVPGMVTFGSPLGLGEIIAEKSTMDGNVGKSAQEELVLAADGAVFATKDALIAARSGVTVGVAAPMSSSQLSGLSFGFSTSAAHPLAKGAVLQDVTALHVSAGHSVSAPVSVQIATLRRQLLGKAADPQGYWKKAADGKLPVVVNVDKADIMARLISLKKEAEHANGAELKLVFNGATEAHLIADEIAAAGVGCIVAGRPYPTGWDQRRIHAGLPLTEATAVDRLVQAGVTVGLGISESWAARNTRFEAGWNLLNSHGVLDDKTAYATVSSNLEKLLGLRVPREFAERDWIAISGPGFYSFDGKVVAKGGAGDDGEGVALF